MRFASLTSLALLLVAGAASLGSQGAQAAVHSHSRGSGVRRVAARNGLGQVRLIVSYCPTDFSNRGAVVDVDPTSGNWTILTKFKFPGDVFGCSADYDPTYSFDTTNSDLLWFDFTSSAGYFVAVDLRYGNTTTIPSSSLFFSGFLDFAEFPKTDTLRGITGTVTQSGYCSDGCIGFGEQDIANRRYHALGTLPFKETADDARFIDFQTNTMYFQAGYDLDSVGCAPLAYEQCLLAVDTETGKLKSTKYSPQQYQVFKYARDINDEGAVKAFMEGFNNFCGQPVNGSATVFGYVNLHTANATAVACVPSSVVIDTDQWVASYSMDETVIATASGNGEGDPPQFVTFNVSSGQPLVNTQLNGLAEALHADMGLIFVWGVEFSW